MDKLEQLEKQAASANARTILECTFPSGDSDPDGEFADGAMFKDSPIVSVGLVELTPREEMMAIRKGAGHTEATLFELAKICIAECNGIAIDRGKGEDETLWSALGSKRRQLIIQMYSDIHQPSDRSAKVFRKSLRRKLG